MKYEKKDAFRSPPSLMSLLLQQRVQLLEKVTREHEQYKSKVDQFQLWLIDLMDRLNCCLDREAKLPAENRIKLLQVLGYQWGCCHRPERTYAFLACISQAV